MEKIDQELHNRGVIFDERFNVVCKILNGDENDEILENIIKTYPKDELFQRLYMYFGSKLFKQKLDQFYTPITICNFINYLMVPNKKAIDPCCGTGDLLNNYLGVKTLCDISNEVIELTKFVNSNLNYKNKILCENSLIYFHKNHSYYDYVTLNPPFGNKTVTNDENILKLYNLPSKELGILFIELSLKLLKPNGIAFIILPNGYLTNSSKKFLRDYLFNNFTIIGVVQFPEKTFSKSGTGVSTSLLIVKNSVPDSDYDILFTKANTIGYNLKSKKYDFLYKKDGTLDNDLDVYKDYYKEFLNSNFHDKKYIQSFSVVKNYDNLLPSRYDTSIYNDVIFTSKTIKSIIDTNIDVYKTIEPDTIYNYIDLSCLSNPLYKCKEIIGSNLPSRAKWKVKKHDILLSRMKGDTNCCIILQDEDNLIASNAICVLRCAKIDDTLLIFNFLNTSYFQYKINTLVSGSIMETVKNDDVYHLELCVSPSNFTLDVLKSLEIVYGYTKSLKK